jgi:elongator complex protein 3
MWFCILFYLGLQKYYTVSKSKALLGFLRLRIDPTPGGDFVPEINNAGLIREVHVYGISTDVGSNNTLSSQHKGLGQKLVKTAEEIVKSHNLNKVAIIAGVGTREYYQNKCGYNLEGTYMTKTI